MFKILYVSIINVNGSNQGSEAPNRDSQLVGVKEVVEETVDEITDEGEGGTQNQHFGFLVFATAVGFQATIYRDDDQSQDEE